MGRGEALGYVNTEGTHVPVPDALDTTTLPWLRLPETGPRSGASYRRLSRDAATGAHTLLIRYPENYAAERRHWFDTDEEIFVISGVLELNGTTYNAGDYGYFPAGYARERMVSGPGAEVLCCFERSNRPAFGDAPPAMYDPRRLILHVRAHDVPWRADGSVEPGVEVRRLRDEFDGMTWLARCEAGATVAAVPARAIEAFVLEGGVLALGHHLPAGSYLWRAPGRAEPYRALPGSLLFFRSKLGVRSLLPS